MKAWKWSLLLAPWSFNLVITVTATLIQKAPIAAHVLGFAIGMQPDQVISTRDYILAAKNSLRELNVQMMKDNSDISSVYRDIDFVLSTTRLRDRLKQATIEANSESTRVCESKLKESIEYKLGTLFEYYSVSNDTAKKMLIGDSYPGEKAEFIRNGLSSIISDLQNFIFCGM